MRRRLLHLLHVPVQTPMRLTLYQQSVGDRLTLASWNILVYRPTLPAGGSMENNASLYFYEGTQMSSQLGVVEKMNVAHPVFLMQTQWVFVVVF